MSQNLILVVSRLNWLKQLVANSALQFELLYVKASLFCYQIIDKSFGFDTAVEEAQRAINAAHVEAESAENGIGVVKLMGRYSGIVHLDLEILLTHSQ